MADGANIAFKLAAGIVRANSAAGPGFPRGSPGFKRSKRNRFKGMA